MARRYAATTKQCWLRSLTHKATSADEIPCKGTRRLFPDFMIRNNTEALCEAHARQYYGDAEIDKLIRLHVIRGNWKVSVDNAPSVQTMKGE